MVRSLRLIALFASALGLLACSSFNSPDYPQTPSAATHGTLLYPEGYEIIGPENPSHAVSVPDSYHVGNDKKPVSHQNIDREWVKGQNAASYTIEVAQSEKASEVANALLKAPKNERMAEIQTQSGNRPSYTGLYGTYPSLDAAKQALQSLPPEIRTNATIKTFGSVQSAVRQTP